MKRRETAAFKKLRDECLSMIDRLEALCTEPASSPNVDDQAKHEKWLVSLRTVAAGTPLTHPLARDVLEARSYLSTSDLEVQVTLEQR